MKKENIIKELIIIFWIFIIGSVIGYIYEMIVVLIQKGYFESRQGLIYGPFTPVYGIGAIIYYLILKKVKTRNKIQIFFITAILGGTTEYICSLVQEKAFGTISWDYSYLPFDINGRTSLLHCTYWGIAGILYITLIEPYIYKLEQKIEYNSIKFITAALSLFIAFDIIISCVAADRQFERRHNVVPENKFDTFLDKHYPDEYMDKVFANKKEVV